MGMTHCVILVIKYFYTFRSMLRQRSSFENVCDEGSAMTTQNNQKSPYPCYSAPYKYPRNCHENLVYVIPSDSNEPNNGLSNNSSEPVTKNAGSRWREDETEALVEIWRNKICQTRWWKQSKGVRVNKEMWEEIASLLADREVYRTPAQCQIRMKNLLQFYRQTIDSRRSEKSWEDLPEYFDIVDRIMTRKDTGVTSHNLPSSVSSNISEGSNLQEMSPPPPQSSNIYHMVDKAIFEQEFNKDRLNENAIDEQKPTATITTTTTSNKRQLSMHSDDEYNGYAEMDLGKPFYPSPSNSIPHHQPPRKIQPHALKNKYSSSLPSYSNHQVHPFSYPTPRLHRESSCNGSCCSSKPEISYSRKMGMKEKELVTEESHSEFSTLTVPPVEQCGMMNNSHIASLPNEVVAKDEGQKQHPYNRYTTPTGYQAQPNPPPLIHHHRHDYMQLYRGGGCASEALHKNIPSSHLVFNQDLLQLQYKQMKTLIEIEKKRLKIEEGRMREEKEANSRTSIYLLEAVKILAETFRKDNNNNSINIDLITREGSKLSPSIPMDRMNSLDDGEN